jgi:glucuronate isomerase
MNGLENELREGLDSLQVADVHTHLNMGGCRQAQTLAEIVSYHWVGVELSRAGADVIPQEAQNDPGGFMTKVVPYFKSIRNTSNHYCLTGMLRDLYGFKDQYLTENNWQAVDQAVRAHAGNKSWVSSVLDKAKVNKVMATTREGTTYAGDRFVPYEVAEYMFAVPVARRMVNGRLTSRFEPFPETLAGLKEATGKRIETIRDNQGIRALHVWIRGSWSYQPYEEREAEALLQKFRASEQLTVSEEDRLISASADILAEAAAGAGMTIQIFHGMCNYSTKDGGILGCTSYYNPEFLRSLAKYANAHPQTMIDVFLGTRIPSHETASLSRVARNIAISGGWWHGFTPTTLTTFFRDRLEMLPNTAWNAFYSDAYIVEWVYGKLLLTKHCLALALAGMEDEGFLAKDDALPIARQLLYDNAFLIYKM